MLSEKSDKSNNPQETLATGKKGSHAAPKPPGLAQNITLVFKMLTAVAGFILLLWFMDSIANK